MSSKGNWLPRGNRGFTTKFPFVSRFWRGRLLRQHRMRSPWSRRQTESLVVKRRFLSEESMTQFRELELKNDVALASAS